MPAELRPFSDSFTDVRRILAAARRTAYTANLHQSRTLTTQRETLLPKLLCWELSVAG